MYHITIEGSTLEELKNKVTKVYQELNLTDSVVEEVKDTKKVTLNPITREVEEVKEETPIELTQEDVKEIKELQAALPDEDEEVEVDKEGIPWDERIHSSSKKKTQKGIWKRRARLDDAEFTRIKNELLAEWAGVEQPESPVVVEEVEETAPATPATPALPAMNKNVYSLQSFCDDSNFALAMANLVTEGKITAEYVEQLKSHFSIVEIWEANQEQKEALFKLFVDNNIIESI